MIAGQGFAAHSQGAVAQWVRGRRLHTDCEAAEHVEVMING